MSGLPIPAALWDRILAFLVKGNYGKIVLNVKDGKVVTIQIEQSYHASDEAA